uniref:U-box domain-containing protein n=1 Tax=Micromonas pusilla TaxID=38833 RepID=A0A7S0NMA0_MICPS|mmetsp:Transcript_621/g.2450  ORF Transcript_621/g.2450 Transcript_621/m.2450 type:complete len:195 (+) Transcript_621:1-585(+)
MAPSKRRKTSAAAQPISGNASSGVQTRRSASAQGDLPDAPDADLADEPEELMCPITRAVFRDPVMVFDSGHTYERSAVLAHFRLNGAKDPLTRRALSSTKVMTNWAVRKFVQAWLDRHPDVTPDGWDSRSFWSRRRMMGRKHSTTRVTSECSGHGVRCALNCRRGGRRTSNRRIGKGCGWKTAGWWSSSWKGVT